MLKERSENILRFIVDHYVQSAHPVPSRAVASMFTAPLSSATIRNEMMRLEEAGYISQPHTSAGRIPLDKGYRYYVESLMPMNEPPKEIQHLIRREFQHAGDDVEAWSRVAAAVLAAHLHNLAIVSLGHASAGRIRWLELTPAPDGALLLSVGFASSRIRQRIIAAGISFGVEELAAMAQRLAARLAGNDQTEIQSLQTGSDPVERAVLTGALALLQEEATFHEEQTFREGLRDVLSQPEFESSTKIIDFLELFEGRDLSRLVPFRSFSEGTVTIVIGSEHTDDSMRDFSVVMGRYGKGYGPGGSIYIIGPTRLNYSSAAGMVRFVSSLMSQLTEDSAN